MLTIGLTGGIGSGKSSVAERLAARGAVVLDADAITRSLQEPGQPVFERIVAEFGAGVVAPDGRLDRAALAAVIFRDADAKRRMERIVHPAVGEVIAGRLAEEAERDGVVVLDIPLLVESGKSGYDGVVVVDTPVEVALDRLVRHRHLDASDARARMANQVSREERLAIADHVVDNSGDPEELEHAAARCWEWIQELRRAKSVAPAQE